MARAISRRDAFMARCTLVASRLRILPHGAARGRSGCSRHGGELELVVAEVDDAGADQRGHPAHAGLPGRGGGGAKLLLDRGSLDRGPKGGAVEPSLLG